MVHLLLRRHKLLLQMIRIFYIAVFVLASLASWGQNGMLLAVPSAATADTFLLDQYPGAEAAYSLRLLSSSYSGECIKVRRASDDTESDIGFSGNMLNESSLSTFCASTDCYVKTWYDQSGNTRDATQTDTTKQPKIYDSTNGIITDNDNSLPAIRFYHNSAKNNLVTSTFATAISQPLTIFSVSHLDSLGESGGANIYDGIGLTDRAAGFVKVSTKYLSIFAGIEFSTSTADDYNAKIRSDLFDGVSSEIWADGVSQGTGNASVGDLGGISIGAFTGNAAGNWKGKIQEVVFYSVNQDTEGNRSSIETNINNYYSIY